MPRMLSRVLWKKIVIQSTFVRRMIRRYMSPVQGEADAHWFCSIVCISIGIVRSSEDCNSCAKKGQFICLFLDSDIRVITGVCIFSLSCFDVLHVGTRESTISTKLHLITPSIWPTKQTRTQPCHHFVICLLKRAIKTYTVQPLLQK